MIENSFERDILLVTEKPDLFTPLAAVIRTILQHTPRLLRPTEVMEQLRRGPCDLLILDIPGIADPLLLLTEIKAARPYLPIMALVPYGEIQMVEQVIALGADDYITQPIALERLRVSLRNALRLGQRWKEAGSAVLPVPLDGRMLSLLRADGSLRSLQEIEQQAIVHAVSHCDGCISQAASSLGIGRSTLYRKLEDAQVK